MTRCPITVAPATTAIVMIPAYGAIGAAVVTAASVAVLNLWQWILADRTVRYGGR